MLAMNCYKTQKYLVGKFAAKKKICNIKITGFYADPWKIADGLPEVHEPKFENPWPKTSTCFFKQF